MILSYFFLLLTRLDKYVRKMDILLIHSTFLHEQLQSDMANPKPAIKINAVAFKMKPNFFKI